MKINLNQEDRTIEIMVPKDQISDELLGALPEPTTTTAEGCLTWSIGFSDAFRAPGTSSSSTGSNGDELLGPVGVIVGTIASNVVKQELDSTLIKPIRTTFQASDSLDTLQDFQEALISELSSIESQKISLGNSSVQAESASRLYTGRPDISVSNIAIVLFSNPFG